MLELHGAELGHISRDCPNRDRETLAKSSQFFLCQGPFGSTNLIFMQQSGNFKKTKAVFAGSRTEAHEAIVDTAAEEAVLRSNAMEHLRQASAKKGLQPIRVHGETAACVVGMGGSASIVAI